MRGHTLWPYAVRYLAGRVDRGELGEGSRQTMRIRLDGLTESFGMRPIDQFGAAAIDRWLASIRHLSPRTRRSYVSTVRGFCRWLREGRVIGRDLAALLPSVRVPRSVPRALPGGDMRQLLEVLPDDRARAIVMLMVGLGLRCCEVASVEVGDYDPHDATIRIVGKGGHERLLPVPVEVGGALDRYAVWSSGPLIRSKVDPSCGVHRKTLSAMVSGWMTAAGVKRRQYDGVSAHALRHTAATDVLDRCHDVRIVQQILGHSNVATTSIYLGRANIGQLRSAMEGRDYRTPAS